MKELTKKELQSVSGGFSFNATFLNAISRGVNVILDLGRSLGSSIRRAVGNNLCPLN